MSPTSYPSYISAALQRSRNIAREVAEAERIENAGHMAREALISGANPLLDKLAYNGFNVTVFFHMGISKDVEKTMPWNHAVFDHVSSQFGSVPNIHQLVLTYQRLFDVRATYPDQVEFYITRVTDDAGDILWTKESS